MKLIINANMNFSFQGYRMGILQSECDAQFLIDMLGECNTFGAWCITNAYLYFSAVRVFGSPYYNNKSVSACEGTGKVHPVIKNIIRTFRKTIIPLDKRR